MAVLERHSGSADTIRIIVKLLQSLAGQNYTVTEENLWPFIYSIGQCDIQA